MTGKLTAAVAGAIFAVLVWVAPAQAVVTWSSETPQVPSVLGRDNIYPAVAMDANGGGVVAWRSQDGSTQRIEAAFRSPGGNFGAPVVVRTATNTVLNPTVKMDPSGNAVAAWYESQSGSPTVYSVHAAFRPAGATAFETQQSVGTPSPVATFGNTPAVTFDGAGNVTLGTSVPGSRVAISTRPAGASKTFSALTPISPTTETASGPALAFDSTGGLMAVWSGNAGDTNTTGGILRASYRPSGGSFSTPTSISAGSDGGSFGAVIKFDASNNALVTFSTAQDDNNSYAGYNYRPAGGSFGPPLPARKVPGSDGGATVTAPDLAFLPSGAALTTFDFNRGFGSGPHDVLSSVRPPGGDFQAASTVQANTSTFSVDPRLGVDAVGEAASVWLLDNGSASRVMAATRSALSSGFGTPQTISATGDFGTSPPQVAVAANGQAIAAWSRLVNGNRQVEVTFGTPPSTPSSPQSPPPPPPPPPEPPVPSAIAPARTLDGDKATVLTARVSGPVTALRWKFDNNAPSITSSASDPGGLHSSVRLRPRSRALHVTLTAFGPGGANTFERTLTLPTGSDDRTSGELDNRIDNLSAKQPVAVGDAAVLTGQQSSCGQLIIKSSRQTMQGCFRPIEDIGDIPSAERGVLEPLASALGVDPNDGDAVRKAVELSDGYAGKGRALINGTWPVQVRGAGTLIHYPQANTLFSSNARFVVAGRYLGPAGTGINFPLDPASTTILLGHVPIPPGLTSVGDFSVVGDIYVSLGFSRASIRTFVRLPSFISKFGNPLYQEIALTGDANALDPANISVGPDNVDFGVLPINDFKLAYKPGDNSWAGEGSACPLDISCFPLTPQDGGGIFIRNGTLAYAGLAKNFGSPGKPLSPGAFLEHLTAGFGLDPSRLIGTARIGTAGLVKIDGKAVAAFPSGRTPYVLRRDEVGTNFPADFYTRPFTNPTIAASAQLKLATPIGEATLGSGYLAYEFPGYVAFGGGFDRDFAGILSLQGGVSGELDASKVVYNLHGDVHACVAGVVCGGAVANLSENGKGDGGVGACIDVGPVSIGGGKLWKRPIPLVWPFDGCKWSPFKLDVRGASVAQAGGGTRITVKRGAANPAVRLTGKGAAPMVRVTGPGGQVLDSTGAKLKLSPGGKIRIIRFETPQVQFTTVGLEGARPGTYTVTTLPGSVPVAGVARATDPPDAKVTGAVTGRGARRTLSYEVRRRPGQTVTFYEVTAAGAARVLRTINGGGRGTLRFTPAPGRGIRHIEARFSLAGLPAEGRQVARFKPPSPVLGKTRGLNVKRGKRSTLRVRWLGVSGAARYEVAVTLSNGRQIYRTTRRRSLVLRGVSKSVSGRVGVLGVARMRQGTVASARFRRTARPVSPFRPVRRCSFTKKTVKKRAAKKKAAKKSTASKKNKSTKRKSTKQRSTTKLTCRG